MSEVPDPDHSRDRRRPLVLLSLGAVAGIVLATWGLFAPGGESTGLLAADAVASVNGAPIRRDDYERMIAAVEQDTRAPIDDAVRKRVLDRMIEEELLVQRALDLGLAKLDRQVRANLTGALIQSVVSEAEDRDPRPGELAEFYGENGEFFTAPGRLRVRQIFLPVAGRDENGVRLRAEEARRRLAAGEPFDEVRAELGGREVSPLPDALLPALKLREYVGPTALRAASELEIGELSEPVRSGTGIHVLQLVEREAPITPPLSEIEPQVESEWRRRLGSDALRRYLDELRAQADVATRSTPSARP